MPTTYHRPSESELMAQCRRALEQARVNAPIIRAAMTAPPPEPLRTPEQQERRKRSLQTCHRPSLYERPRHAPPKDSGAYVPETAAGLDNDRNLTDGARRCARKILEETYRRDRQGRKLQVTVSYLARALNRSTRTVQRYLGMLEREGYVGIEVMSGHRSRMCIGLIVHLLTPVFPRHHRRKWPETRRNPATTKVSENNRNPYLDSYNQRFRVLHEPRCRRFTRNAWALKCMDGVFRALMKTNRASPGSLLPSGEGSVSFRA